MKRPHRSIFIRIACVVTCIIAIFAVLFYRAVELQVWRGSTYLARADSNRFATRPLPAIRGLLLDRYGEPLVWNTQQYYQLSHPELLSGSRSLIDRTQALNLLSTSSGSAIVESEIQRLYRYPFALSPILGYIGETTAAELQKDPDLRVGEYVGKAGLELQYDQELRGQDGEEEFEINALAEKQRLVRQILPQSGQNVTTTLDPYVTEVAARALTGLKGTVIITDAETGDVLTLTTQPTYDANVLSQRFADDAQEASRQASVQSFFQDPRKLFFNRAVAGAYPPGSVFKIVTALAGLADKKVDRSTTVIDEGKITAGGSEFGNWYFRQYGRVEGAINLVRALARSNDIFFYKLAEWTGPEHISDMARSLGLGARTNLGLPGEVGGTVPDPNWKLAVIGERWYLGDTYHYGIGQGNLLTTPVQIAQLTQTLANHGLKCHLSLSRQEKPNCESTNISLDDLNMVLEGMVDVCSSGGTAFPFFSYNAAHVGGKGVDISDKLSRGAVACKTGTAEFGAADVRGYRHTHAWFTSLLEIPDAVIAGNQVASVSATASESATLLPDTTKPSEASASAQMLHQLWREQVVKHGFPKHITITVLVESDDQNAYKEGSADAAPIARTIVDWLVK